METDIYGTSLTQLIYQIIELFTSSLLPIKSITLTQKGVKSLWPKTWYYPPVTIKTGHWTIREYNSGKETSSPFIKQKEYEKFLTYD